MAGQVLRFQKPHPPEAGMALSAGHLAKNGRVKLHDGDLILLQRESVKGIWQYQLKLPDSTFERRSTGERTYERARRVAEDRWIEVRWRAERGFSTKAATFAQAAQSYTQRLKV